MGDLKNKFMDILFEDDTDDDVSDNENVDKNNIKEKANITNTTGINVKDLLYRKSDSSPFIDLEETIASSSNNIVDGDLNNNDEYELSAQISPIFGVIKKAERKTTKVSSEIIKSQTVKPADSHLDIITSPIYGYGNKEDAIDNNYNVKGVGEYINDEEEQLHDLFDNNDPSDMDVMSDDSLDDDISLFRLFGDNK